MEHDLIIRGGTVVDGSGGPRRAADLAVGGGRIAAVGDLGGAAAREEIDAAGLVVAPGFIDAHTHDDQAVFADPAMTPKVSQGVTTVIAGNCGLSLAPRSYPGVGAPPSALLGTPAEYRFPTVAGYRAALEESPAALNLALLVGHSTLRIDAMDNDIDRPATAAEIAAMADKLDESLAAGAIGLSTGLAYPVAKAAPTDEVVALAQRLPAHGGIYTTHMRDEGAAVLDSIAETAEIGRRSGARVVISHHKCAGEANWGRSVETLAAIEAARETLELDFDVYPYTASSTVLLPDWAPQARRILVTWSDPHPEMAGRELAAIAADWGCDRDAAIRRLMPAGAIYFTIDEGDLRRILAHRRAMVGSDGIPGDRHPHPRLWGTFPRVLGRYVREAELLTLEEAVFRMTGLTAQVFGLAGRGVLAPGNHADLTLFDPATVLDEADFDHPKRPARGIHSVWVAGQAVWRDSTATGARPGRFLARGEGRG
ncbi:MAG: D-aminoacylase [Hyphomicrobiales bacterium]|nr:D-aminoacylase [Hyphomicrobiales bacterium]